MDTLHITGALFTGDVIQYTQQLRVLSAYHHQTTICRTQIYFQLKRMLTNEKALTGDANTARWL